MKNSPPVGTGATASSLAGMGSTPTSKGAPSASAANHEPFSTKPTSPVKNRSQAFDWLSVVADFGAQPFAIQSESICAASTAPSDPGAERSAPEPQNHGRNWNTPSSPATPAKVIAVSPPSDTCSRAEFNEAQSLICSGSTPASSRISLL